MDAPKFRLGQRVRVTETLTWAQGATATVSLSVNGVPSPFGSHVREVTRVTAPLTSHWSYWVVFDEPQIDADGDGPYITAELGESYLEPE